MQIQKILIFLLLLVAMNSVVAKEMSSQEFEKRIARKEAKKMKKQGWKIFQNDLPLNRQLLYVYEIESQYKEMQIDTSSVLTPAYILSIGISDTCATLEEAEITAIERAKLSLYEEYCAQYPSSVDSLSVKHFLLLEELEYVLGEYGGEPRQYYINVEVCKEELIRKTIFTYLPEKSSAAELNVFSDMIYWDAVRRTCFNEPIVTNAQPLLRLYREVPDGYQVQVRCCSENIKYDE